MGRRRMNFHRKAKAKIVYGKDSDRDIVEAPILKRQRTNQVTKPVVQKMQTWGKQGQLAGMMKMPTDIFNEIASHLTPEDIIALSRSNKFFRNMLMRRSAIYIWRGAMRNVPKLPPCPPDMCEPQYLALIYMPTCSMCGGNGPKRMDEILRVRLCNSCRNSSIMLTGDLPEDVEDLVHKSSKIASGTPHWPDEAALRSDIGAVLVKIEELKVSKDCTAFDRWKAKREEELETREKQAAVLSAFLDHLDTLEIARQNDVKSARRAEIERRLIALGWENEDIQLDYVGTREWKATVEQPIPLTEPIWANLKPKLIQMLESNRTIRLANEELQRKDARRLKLVQILDDLRATDLPLIDARISGPTTRPASDPGASAILQVSHRRLFPLAIDLLEYPIVKSLDESDIPESEMEARFEEHREQIKAHVSEWRIKTEGYMADLLRKGRVMDGLEVSAPAPVLPFEESELNPFDGVSDDLKLLLRADSIFKFNISSLNTPVTYDILLASANISIAWGIPRTAPLDLTIYERHAKAQDVARALLAELGKPDASFLELKNIGHLFKCGRCQNDSTYSWEAMIRHYLDAQRDWKKFQHRLPKAQELGITLQHLHSLDTEVDKPLVQVLDSVQYAGDISYSGPHDFQCLLCIKIGMYDTEVTRAEIIEHITKWHGVAKPKRGEHYDQTERGYSDDESDNDSDDDVYAPYGFGHCSQGCCVFGSDDNDAEDDDEDEDEWW